MGNRRRLLLEQGQKNLFNYLVKINSVANFEEWDKVNPRHCCINGASSSIGNRVAFASTCCGIIMPANVKSISVKFFNGIDGNQRRYLYNISSDLITISRGYYADALLDGITLNAPDGCVDFWYVQFTAGASINVKKGIVVVKGNKIPDKYIPYEE